MRKALGAVLAMVLAAAMAQAGGPPRGGGGPGNRGRRGGARGDFFTRMMGRRDRLSVFDAAQRYFDLTEEQNAAVDGLEGLRGAEERAAIAELNKQLDKKYVALILEVLPAAEKPKFEKVFAAMTERDEAIEAARKEFRTVLDKVETDQKIEQKAPPDYIPFEKTDLVRRFIKLTEQQQTGTDAIRRDGWGGMREKMRNIPRPQDWRDAQARRQYGIAVRKAREEVDEGSAKAMVQLLSEDQQKAYQTAATAFDVYRKKVDEAEAAYEKKIVDLVGEEKARAPRRAPAGGAPRARQGEL